jgi:hypothetical protein
MLQADQAAGAQHTLVTEMLCSFSIQLDLVIESFYSFFNVKTLQNYVSQAGANIFPKIKNCSGTPKNFSVHKICNL